MKDATVAARWYQGVTFKLTRLFLLFVLLPTALLSSVTYQFGSAALEKAATEKLESAISLKERSIATWFEEEKSFIRVLAQDALVAQYGVKLLALQGGDPRFNETYATLQAHFQSILVNMPDLLRISILSDIGGREVLSTDASQEGRYHLTDSFFTLGREGTYVQKVYFSERLNAAVMIIATPLKNDDGETVGVLYAALDPAFLYNTMLDRTGLGATGETYVVDTRHMLVTGVQGTPAGNVREVHTEGINAGLDKQSGHAIYNNYQNLPVIGFYRWLDEPKLALLAEVNVAEALEPISRLKRLILYAMLFIVAVALIIAWFVARGITRPVLGIATAANRVALGDLNQHAPVLTRDEIGDLSESFNAMTSALRETAQEKNRALDDLQVTNSELQAATKAKNIFLANMSHELRTPLNAIIGYSEILKEQAEDEQRQDEMKDLERIHAAGRHLLSLIDDILDLTRIEAGKVELISETFPVRAFVDGVAEIAQPLMQRHNNVFNIVCADDIGDMVGDQTRLRQVLLNLLSNAAKFTENGTVTLAVDKRGGGDNRWLRFSVRDTGIGIATEQLSRIFQEFVQGDLSATKRFGGAGLGLAITKRFCSLMGGNVRVTSVVGQGSEFVVELPERDSIRPEHAAVMKKTG